MVFCINLQHIKIQLSFIHTNFKYSVLITKENILAIAKKTILSESEAITKLIDFLDENFYEAVQRIYETKGRLIVTGIGKSAIIAQKMVATFNSTGTPSMFLHAAEAIHGDLGMIQNDDIIICISKSVALDYLAYLQEMPIQDLQTRQLGWFPLGADFEAKNILAPTPVVEEFITKRKTIHNSIVTFVFCNNLKENSNKNFSKYIFCFEKQE